METTEQKVRDLISFGQKTPKSLVQQCLEGYPAVGKDEAAPLRKPCSFSDYKVFSYSFLDSAKSLKKSICSLFVLYPEIFVFFSGSNRSVSKEAAAAASDPDSECK